MNVLRESEARFLERYACPNRPRIAEPVFRRTPFGAYFFSGQHDCRQQPKGRGGVYAEATFPRVVTFHTSVYVWR